jgi:hypothetical protein
MTDMPIDALLPEEDGPRLVLTGTYAIIEGTVAPLTWVVPGYVGEGLTILAGRQKVGKTWLAMDWACAVASGGKAMGAIPCEAGGVLYVDLENGRRRVRSRLAVLHPEPTRPDLSQLAWAREAPPLGKGLVEALDGWRSSVENPLLVVVDASQGPAWRTAAGEVAHLANLQGWATTHGLAVVWLHRMRKVGDPLVALGGSGGVFGFADAILLLDRNGEEGTLERRGRDGEDKHSALTFAAGIWSLVGEKETAQSEERTNILAVLEAGKEAMGPRDVAEALGMRPANVRMTMSRMAREGDLIRVGHGLYRSSRAAKEEAHNDKLAKALMDEFVEHCHRNKPPGGAAVEAVPGLAKWLKAPTPGAKLTDMPGFMEWLDSHR